MQTGYVDGVKIEELTTPKTFNSFRTVPFFGDVAELLRRWKEIQDDLKERLGCRWRGNPDHGNLIFTSSMGSPITRYMIVHDINKVERQINLKKSMNAYREGREPIVFEHMHPHAFRHTFATRCFEKGLDPLFVRYSKASCKEFTLQMAKA